MTKRKLANLKWETDPSGRARCRYCGEKIVKGCKRLNLEEENILSFLFCERCGLKFIIAPLVAYCDLEGRDLKKFVGEISSEVVFDKLIK